MSAENKCVCDPQDHNSPIINQKECAKTKMVIFLVTSENYYGNGARGVFSTAEASTEFAERVIASKNLNYHITATYLDCENTSDA